MHNRVLRATLPCVVALLLLACACGMAWAADATAIKYAKVPVFQEYRVSASGLQSTFDYAIVPLETGAPLPVDKFGESFDTFSLKRDEKLTLEFPVEVSYSESADSYVYHYTLKPASEKLAGGLYYVDVQSTNLEAGANVYYLELHVQLASTDAASAVVTPTVHVEEWDGPKVTDPGWRVSYKKSSEPEQPSTPTKPTTTQAGTTRGTGTTSATSTTPTSTQRLTQSGDRTAWGVAATYALCGVLLITLSMARRLRAGDNNA